MAPAQSVQLSGFPTWRHPQTHGRRGGGSPWDGPFLVDWRGANHRKRTWASIILSFHRPAYLACYLCLLLRAPTTAARTLCITSASNLLVAQTQSLGPTFAAQRHQSRTCRHPGLSPASAPAVFVYGPESLAVPSSQPLSSVPASASGSLRAPLIVLGRVGRVGRSYCSLPPSAPSPPDPLLPPPPPPALHSRSHPPPSPLLLPSLTPAPPARQPNRPS
ncbi:hypothetical protein FDECE_7723 [Fusarium decemcellulare]|nr:hypothetical protein FDECE_7723 [Fusarium decemcellulare]